MTPTISDIQRVVCERFGVTEMDMLSHRRSRRVARPRQVAMYLARELTPASLPMIGRQFADRDHSTVSHACQTIEALCEQDRDVADVVAELRQALSEPGQMLLPQITSAQVKAAQYSRLMVVWG